MERESRREEFDHAELKEERGGALSLFSLIFVGGPKREERGKKGRRSQEKGLVELS